jgi:hypothetical protein
MSFREQILIQCLTMSSIVLHDPSLGFLEIKEFRVHENDVIEMISKDSSDNRSCDTLVVDGESGGDRLRVQQTFLHIQLRCLAVSASSAGPEHRAL